ncbi:MAG: glycosyltransferase family 39 protein [Massilia sp.]
MFRKLLLRVANSVRRIAPMQGVVALPQGARPQRLSFLFAPATLYGAVAVLAPAFFFLYGLDAFPLRDINEGLYAEIAREMLSSGDYIVPHLNGVPYIEKPPLLYWLMSLSMAIFGPTAAAARLVSALSMLSLCVALFRFCALRGQARLGCHASVILASALPVALLSHAVLFDPLLTAMLGISLLCFLHAYLTHSRSALRAATVLLGLATLEKGFVALVLEVGTLTVFLLLMRDLPAWKKLIDRTGLGIVAAMLLPWHLAAALKQHGFSWFYFVNEHLLRFTGQRLPDDFHRGPWWFYLPRLVLLLLPWTPFLLLLVRSSNATAVRNRPIVCFCQAMILFPLQFFSLSQAKAEYYMLVAAPALALWLAVETGPRLGIDGDRLLAWSWGAAFATAVLLLVLAGTLGQWQLKATVIIALALGWIVLAHVGARGFGKLRSPLQRELAMLVIVLAAGMALVQACHGVGRRGERDSSFGIAQLILQRAQPAGQVLIYRDFEDTFSTLPFYLGRTLPVIDSASRDLLFGCQASTGVSCLTPDEFRRLHLAGPVAVAVHAQRASDFLAMAGTQGWSAARAGEKMVFFHP